LGEGIRADSFIDSIVAHRSQVKKMYFSQNCISVQREITKTSPKIAKNNKKAKKTIDNAALLC